MNARTKSVLIIAAALFAGFLIGALSVGAILNYRIDQLRQLRQPAGFAGVVEDVIRPESEAQRRQIREVLRATSERNMELRSAMRSRHVALLDSLRTDLRDVLSPEQEDRLEEWIEQQARPMRFRRGAPHGQQGYGRRGPPRGERGDSVDGR